MKNIKKIYIDIGNTSIKVLLNEKLFKFKVYAQSIKFLKINALKYDLVVFSSVVRLSSKKLINDIRKLKKNIIKIDNSFFKNFINYNVDIKSVGTDRLLCAYGSTNKYKSNDILIIDYGTATTIDIVKNAKYFGGIILPGLLTSYENLISVADGIKYFKYKNFEKYFGTNTEEALLSGFNTGYSLMISSYIDLLKKKFRKPFLTVCTGGFSKKNSFIKSNIIYNEKLIFYSMKEIINEHF